VVGPYEIDPEAITRTKFGPEAKVDYTVDTEIEIADAVIMRFNTTVYSERETEVGPNEFCFQLATLQFQSGIEICSEINVALNFRCAASINQSTIIYTYFEEHINAFQCSSMLITANISAFQCLSMLINTYQRFSTLFNTHHNGCLSTNISAFQYLSILINTYQRFSMLFNTHHNGCLSTHANASQCLSMIIKRMFSNKFQ
jgi:hypothetical protein